MVNDTPRARVDRCALEHSKVEGQHGRVGQVLQGTEGVGTNGIVSTCQLPIKCAHKRNHPLVVVLPVVARRKGNLL